MSASKWTSCLCLLSCLLCCSISEDPQQLLLTAYSGRDVTLSCQAPDNVAISVVEWMRFDPKRHVYTKRDGRVVTADQDPSYVNRTQLKDDEMKNGDLSLVLKKVKSNDEGRYECRYVGEGRGRMKRGDQSKLLSTVHLDVGGAGGGDQEGGGQRGGDQEGGGHLAGLIVSLIINVVAGAGLGFLIYKKLRGRTGNNPGIPGEDPDVHQQLH